MKKNLVTFSTLLLLAITSISCNKNSPNEVATTWLTSFYHLDYETPKKISTDNTKSLLATLQQFATMVSDSDKKEYKKITVNVKDVKEKGDTAFATYTTSNEPGKDQSLELVKLGGKWLVEFSKNDQVSGAADTMGTEPQVVGDTTTSPGSSSPDTSLH